MNPTQLSLIGLRLLGIYFVIQSINNAPGVYLTISTFSTIQEMGAVTRISFIASLFIPLIFGIVLWITAPKLSLYINSNKQIDETNATLSTHQFQSSALAIIGIYLLTVNIPTALSINYLLLQGAEEASNYNKVFNDIVINAITVDLKILFALILVIGSKSISSAINNLRTAGTN